MLLVRTITAAVGIPLLIGLAYAGGYWWDGLMALLAIVSVYELSRMAGIESRLLLALSAILTVCLVLRPLYPGNPPGWLPLVVVMAVILVALIDKFNIDGLQLGWALASAGYIGYLLSYSVAINHQFSRAFLVLLTAFLITWASDTGAYFAGRLWGKRKLSPSLSPNKTWAGAIGGLVLSDLVSWVLLSSQLGTGGALLFGLAASVLAQVGDLFESLLKRYFGVKDSGYILPGHGGVLDRFDSFLLVAPLIYYVLR